MSEIPKSVGQLRSIYLDDLDVDQKTYGPHISALLSTIFQDPALDIYSDTSDFLPALGDRPHFAFVDNDLGQSKENYGLQLISSVKPSFPDVVFILITGKALKAEHLGAFTPNPDLVLAKQYVGTAEYDDYISKTLLRLLRRTPLPPDAVNAIDLRKDGPKLTASAKLTPKELLSLIEQSIHPGTNIARHEPVAGAALSVVSGGFSGSGVYSIKVCRVDGKPSAPAILKISEVTRATEEYENYLRFVKWRLPYTWRVDVLGSGTTCNYGSICYSFALGGSAEPKAINSYIRNGDLSVIELVLNTILNANNQTWYSEKRGSARDAREYFGAAPFFRVNKQREERQAYFIECLRAMEVQTGERLYLESEAIAFLGYSFSFPNKAIFNRAWGEIVECISHGDLNGNNLLYAGDGKTVVFIDFQNTGFWYRFRDFISFESSVKLEFPLTRDGTEVDRLKYYISTEARLNSDEWEQSSADEDHLGYCVKVRRAAHANFTDESYCIYVVANVVHSMWLLSKAAKWSAEKRLRLLGTIVAGLLYIDSLKR